MTTFLATLAGLAACLGLLLWLFKDQQKLGKIIQRNKDSEEALKGAREVVFIRERLKNDNEFATKVREKYTRPE